LSGTGGVGKVVSIMRKEYTKQTIKSIVYLPQKTNFSKN
jgi:hypothetical protein